MPEGVKGYLIESWITKISRHASPLLHVPASEIAETRVRSEYSQVFLGQTVDGALRQVKSLGDELRANTECVKLADGGKIVRTKMQVVTLRKVMTSQELASECGEPYDAIKETAYAIARKRGLEVRRSNDGLECFQRKEQFRVTRYSEKGENAGGVEQ